MTTTKRTRYPMIDEILETIAPNVVAAVVPTRSQIGWQVERLPIHGCRVVDNTGRLIAADVYDEDIAEQIVTEHNQHVALVAERERLREALRRVRAVFFRHAESGAYIEKGKLIRLDNEQHPWIPGADAPEVIGIIDSALTTVEQEGGRRG